MDDHGPIPPQQVATPPPGPGAPTLRDVGLVAAGGSLGALVRVALAERFPTGAGAFPWTTFAENLVGAFLLGVVLTVLVERRTSDRRLRLLVCTGALGAFTTYSTFAGELGVRLLDGHVVLAVGYAVASLGGGLLVAWLGIRAARRLPMSTARRA